MYQVNFLPWRMAQLKVRYRFWRNCFLIQGLVAITVMIVMLSSWIQEQQQQQAKILALSQQQEKYQAAYELTSRGFMKLKKMQSFQQMQHKEQLHAQRYLMLLQQLSLLIPDNCWISALKEQNDILILVAGSDDHTAIMAFFHKLNEQKELGNIYLNKVEQSSDAKYHFIIHADWNGLEKVP